MPVPGVGCRMNYSVISFVGYAQLATYPPLPGSPPDFIIQQERQWAGHLPVMYVMREVSYGRVVDIDARLPELMRRRTATMATGVTDPGMACGFRDFLDGRAELQCRLDGYRWNRVEFPHVAEYFGPTHLTMGDALNWINQFETLEIAQQDPDRPAAGAFSNRWVVYRPNPFRQIPLLPRDVQGRAGDNVVYVYRDNRWHLEPLYQPRETPLGRTQPHRSPWIDLAEQGMPDTTYRFEYGVGWIREDGPVDVAAIQPDPAPAIDGADPAGDWQWIPGPTPMFRTGPFPEGMGATTVTEQLRRRLNDVYGGQPPYTAAELGVTAARRTVPANIQTTPPTPQEEYVQNLYEDFINNRRNLVPPPIVTRVPDDDEAADVLPWGHLSPGMAVETEPDPTVAQQLDAALTEHFGDAPLPEPQRTASGNHRAMCTAQVDEP